MENNICVYEIQRAPYLAVSSVFRTSPSGCLIEDTHGHLRKVHPIYVVPFDHEKLRKSGEVLVDYFRKGSKMKIQDVHDRMKEIFCVTR